MLKSPAINQQKLDLINENPSYQLKVSAWPLPPRQLAAWLCSSQHISIHLAPHEACIISPLATGNNSSIVIGTGGREYRESMPPNCCLMITFYISDREM